MVMADYSDPRRRRRPINKERPKAEEMSQTLRVPVILSKNVNVEQSEVTRNHEKIFVLSKTLKKEETTGSSTKVTKHANNGIIPDGTHKVSAGLNRENPRDLVLTFNYPSMAVPSKLINGLLKWNDTGSEFMIEKTDYVVVGVLGLQNVGKSTVLSYLGEVPEKNNKLIFKPQTKGTRESGIHVTSGVDMFVTKERMILLDCQALLSISNLIDIGRHEKKHVPDFARFDASIDIQSVQLVAFMMSVCNYVIVTMDWFADSRLFTILRLAEMLKPLLSYEEMQRDEKAQVSTATLIFALNKARQCDVDRRAMMEKEIESFMEGSRINYKGSLHGEFSKSSEGVNLVYLPRMNRGFNGESPSNGGNFKGSMDFEETLRSLGHQLLTLPRKLPINKFSEGKWLVFAMRAWDLIRKSQLMNDYDHLLS